VYGAGALVALGPYGIPIFLAQLQLSISLIAAGISLLFDFSYGCVFAISTAFSALRALLVVAQSCQLKQSRG
jgi:hypothetical protein